MVLTVTQWHVAVTKAIREYPSSYTKKHMVALLCPTYLKPVG